MTTITAEVIADSVNPYGSRLTTMVWEYPRYLHPQVMTHRAFSRNSASSRAVPTSRYLHKVMTNPVIPVHWGKLRSGMQAVEEMSLTDQAKARDLWLRARGHMVSIAKELLDLGLHKQEVNRLLEAFLHNRLIVSATELANFFHLRDHGDTQHGTQVLARAVKQALAASTPKAIQWGEWHLPWIREDEVSLPSDSKIRISCARSARVSYFRGGTKTVDAEEDFKLYSRLVDREDWGKNPIHASATEHAAQARNPEEIKHISWLDAFEMGLMSNFHPSWLQHRKTIPGENIPTERIQVHGNQ